MKDVSMDDKVPSVPFNLCCEEKTELSLFNFSGNCLKQIIKKLKSCVSMSKYRSYIPSFLHLKPPPVTISVLKRKRQKTKQNKNKKQTIKFKSAMCRLPHKLQEVPYLCKQHTAHT